MRHRPYRVPVYSLPFLNTNAYTPQKGWARRWIPRIEGKHKSCRLVRGPACNDMLPLSQKPKLTVRTQGDSCDWRRRPARHAQWADLQQKPRTTSTSSRRYHTHRSPCPARVEDLGVALWKAYGTCEDALPRVPSITACHNRPSSSSARLVLKYICKPYIVQLWGRDQEDDRDRRQCAMITRASILLAEPSQREKLLIRIKRIRRVGSFCLR